MLFFGGVDFYTDLDLVLFQMFVSIALLCMFQPEYLHFCTLLAVKYKLHIRPLIGVNCINGVVITIHRFK